MHAARPDRSPRSTDPASASSGDPAQEFVSRLRSAAPGFATAAGAQTAVVREAVPPARHRRSRCRVVLRYPDGGESDVTFLGAVSAGQGVGLSIGTEQFGAEIEQWLGAGQGRDARWLVPDEEAADGTAVDVVAWLQQA